MPVKLSKKYLQNFIREDEYASISHQIAAAHTLLENRSGAGNDFLGWLDLPVNYDKEEFARIQAAAKRIRESCDVLVVIGIGGSYLGARAAIEFLNSPFYNQLRKPGTPEILFCGNNISGDYLNDIIAMCGDRDICVNVISKSGTTTEPAVAFRYFRDYLIKKYGADGAKQRIFATTDKARGTLKELSDREGYETFVIPDDVGGRYSVLTAVGLLPIAVAGCDIKRLMQGAADARAAYSVPDMTKNDAYLYAAIRNILYNKGYSMELMVCYEPRFREMNEWIKQLYGESEGKDNKGLFPASVIFSTDLHSLGQYVQDGRRQMFETVVTIDKPVSEFIIPEEKENFDGLNFLAGKPMSYVNRKAFEGTLLAHTEEGHVPNVIVSIDKADEYELGYLIYFFEKTTAVSGYVLGINPFDQPGVESYKRNMFALLGKPGYEDLKKELEARL